MFITLVIREILDAILSYRFMLVALLCLVLVPLSLFVSLKNYEYRMESFRELDKTSQAQAAKKDVYHNHSFKGYRRPSLLSIFSHGLGDKLPHKVTVRNSGVTIETRRDQGNLYSALWGRIDFVFIVTNFLSILAIIFSYSTICGEKDTLRLVAANDVSRSNIILGKITGNFLVFLVPFFMALLIGLVMLTFSPGFSLTNRDTVVPLLLVVILTVGFLFVIFCLGVLVSLFTRQPNSSLVLLLFLWILMSLVIPKTSPMIAHILIPLRSEQSMEREVKAVLKNINQEQIGEESKLYKQCQAEAGDKEPEPEKENQTRIMISSSSFGQESQAVKNMYDQRVGPIRGKYETMKEKAEAGLRDAYNKRKHLQLGLSRLISQLSPVSGYVYAVTELCGTGFSEIENFQDHSEAYYRNVKHAVYDLWETKTYYMGAGHYTSSTGPKKGVDFKALRDKKRPELYFSQYRMIPLSVRVRKILFDVLLTFIYGVLFFSVAYVKFIRYDMT